MIMILPIILLMFAAIMQFASIAVAKVTAEAAAMDGARMAIVDGDYQTAVRKVAGRYDSYSSNLSSGSDYVTVKVEIRAPVIFFKNSGSIPIKAEVTLRKE